MALRLAACGVGAALVAAAPAPAETANTITLGPLPFARAAIATGNYRAAQSVLDALLARDPGDVEANFLRATLDARQGRRDVAIARFRRILRDHPGLVRVRLDYAQALFDAGDDDAAEYNFRLALDADLPAPVRENAMAYLHAIRARRRYSLSAALSLAPDTNINAGTGLNEITLFGLPFAPGAAARKKSGLGVMAALAGEYRYPLGETVRLRSNASLWRSDYAGGRFDDMIVRAELGPQLVLQDWSLSALGVYTQRWYANDPFDVGAGPRIEAVYHGFERWRIEGNVEYLRLGYHTETFQNGDYVSANLSPDFALPPSAFLRPIIGVYRQLAASPAFADTGVRFGLGYHQELGRGITAELQGEVFLSYYDGPNALFGTTRRDQTLRVTASAYRRDWIVFGLNPVLSVVYTRNASNQALFAYRRTQFELGFTKAF
jgi:outer membrane protein